MASKFLMKGNEAVAEAAINAGCRLFFGYPITPQNEICAYMAAKMPKANGVYLQAESELAAINMVLGASSTGKRAMTSSSSPGIALKSEGLSYMAGSDLPAVVVNVQRGGPGLGSIQPSQADYYLATKSAGHGDFHMIVLAPKNVQEMYDLTYKAFDLADTYRMTAMILSDGVLGQMMEPVAIESMPPVQLPPKDWALTGTRKQRKQNIITSLYLEPEDLERMNKERYIRYTQVMETESSFETYRTEDAEIIIAAYGACARVSQNAVDDMRNEGIKAGLIRPITLWPFPKNAMLELSRQAKGFVVVEMSMGQMVEDVELAIKCSKPIAFCGRPGGTIPKPAEITATAKELIRRLT